MSARSPRHAPRRWGPRIFLAGLAVFWALLGLSGRSYFQEPELAEIEFTVRPADLVGMTGLRIEGDQDHGRGARVRVVLDDRPDVRIRLRPTGRGDEDPDQPISQEPRMAATREGDTLVLRWTGVPAHTVSMRGHPAMRWVDEIVLPLQFRHLALQAASVDVRSPVAQLEVAGQWIEVEGSVRQLDLWSTHCRPCEEGEPGASDPGATLCAQPSRRDEGLMGVTASDMVALRVNARAGNLRLGRGQGLERLDLQLDDSVALTLDHAGLLSRLHRGSDARPLAAPVVCYGRPVGEVKAVELVPAP